MHQQGFAIYEGVFSDSEVDALLALLRDASISKGRAGTRNLMANPAIANVSRDVRLLELLKPVFGKAPIPYKATLFEKSGKANWLVAWHQDKTLPLAEHLEHEEWGPWSIKGGIQYAQAPSWALARVWAIRIHLDDSTGENGPLRVIPGSHKFGVLPPSKLAESAGSHSQVECTVGRGGVMVMSPLLIHSSSKAMKGSPRRVLHIEYTDSLELGDGIRLCVA